MNRIISRYLLEAKPLHLKDFLVLITFINNKFSEKIVTFMHKSMKYIPTGILRKYDY
jgi:hypothetical protein